MGASHMYGRVHEHTWVHVWGGQGITSSAVLQPCVLSQGLSLAWDVWIQAGLLARILKDLRNYNVLTTRITNTCHGAWVQGIRLGFQCLCGKHLMYQAICTAPEYTFPIKQSSILLLWSPEWELHLLKKVLARKTGCHYHR